MTKEFNKETINNLAAKLLIHVTDEETELVLNELDYLKDKMDLITKIEGIEKVVPQTHPFDLFESALREDTNCEEGTDIELLLSNAKAFENREIEVPKVVG